MGVVFLGILHQWPLAGLRVERDQEKIFDVSHMSQRPTIVIDGMRVELNDREFLIIVTPNIHGDADMGERILSKLIGIKSECVLVLANVNPDSTLHLFVPPGFEEDFRGQIFSASQVTKIPIYD